MCHVDDGKKFFNFNDLEFRFDDCSNVNKELKTNNNNNNNQKPFFFTFCERFHTSKLKMVLLIERRDLMTNIILVWHIVNWNTHHWKWRTDIILISILSTKYNKHRETLRNEPKLLYSVYNYKLILSNLKKHRYSK